MRDEVSGKRPSPLSKLFREWAAPGAPLADWTRCVDGDWCWYCPECSQIVALIEEKTDRSRQRAWTVTRRLATRHEDRPWGLRVTCHDDGTISAVRARNGLLGHQSEADTKMTRDDLLEWITAAFDQHYEQSGHRRAA